MVTARGERCALRRPSVFVTIGLLSAVTWTAAVADPTTVHTISDLLDLLGEVEIRILMDTEVGGDELLDPDAFVPLINYVDLNVIGKGRPAVLDPDAVVRFIAEHRDPAELPRALVEAYRSAQLAGGPEVAPARGRDEDRLRLGGFLVAELEYHQNDNLAWETLVEVNQARLYFAADLGRVGSGSARFLAEWNPVPEEVIHQIDRAVITRGAVQDTLAPPAVDVHEGVIEFEQLYAEIDDVGGSGITLSVGQFRNPFGLWSDYSSHRNFSSTKNNQLVNGFALKKIELGAMASRRVGHVELRGAVVHGRLTRTSPLPREDADGRQDLVGRVGVETGPVQLGGSFYLAEASTDRVAYGIDWMWPGKRFSASGELVYQRNAEVNATFGTAFPFDVVSSRAGYAQVLVPWKEKCQLYGLYDVWSLRAGGRRVGGTTYRFFHGVKYSWNEHLRWTVLEYGRMVQPGFRASGHHISTQLEVTF